MNTYLNPQLVGRLVDAEDEAAGEHEAAAGIKLRGDGGKTGQEIFSQAGVSVCYHKSG